MTEVRIEQPEDADGIRRLLESAFGGEAEARLVVARLLMLQLRQAASVWKRSRAA